MAPLSLGVVSTYPPREDGLATFTHDLLDALHATRPDTCLHVAAINALGAHHQYPPEVRHQIRQGVRSAYAYAATALNYAPIDVITMQHEFTLYGRWDEAHVHLDDHTPALLDALDKPLVTTLHTVPRQPEREVLAAVRHLHERSAALIVMARTAVNILGEDYGVDGTRIVTIPHGVPPVPSWDAAAVKRELDVHGDTVLCTFGLLRRSKGIEHVIRALPAIVERHPEVVYLVVGATHPEVRQQQGETYRQELAQLARALGVGRHVRFVNKYLCQDDLLRYLCATDIYITPYLDREQITSGTLAYALGFGLAIVSTPYVHAIEALSEGRGLLAEFGSPESIARCVMRYLDDPAFACQTRERARAYGRAMSWPCVAERYAEVLERVIGG